VFDQRAFQFERADAVIGGFEHVVGAADIGVVTIGIAPGDVAGAIGVRAERRERTVVALVPAHQPGRRRIECDAHFAFLDIAPVLVQQANAVAGRFLPHRAGLHDLSGIAADLQRGFGLAVALPDRFSPDLTDMADHFGIERLARRAQFAQ